MFSRPRGVRPGVLATELAPATWSTGPAVIEEYGSTVPVHPGFAARVDRFGNLLVTGGGAA